MRVALFDTNVLIALFDPDHIHHATAHTWFAANRGFGWATCPITLNGCIRIMSRAGYEARVSVTEAMTLVQERIAQDDHFFWPDSILLTSDLFIPEKIKGPKQITDVYLLGLAVANNGRLATFDQSIPISAVRGATSDNLATLQNPLLAEAHPNA